MGAFIGAMFAVGMDAEEIDARCYEEWVRRRPLATTRVPRHGLIRGQRVEAMLQPHVRRRARSRSSTAASSATTADLRTGELVVSRTGRCGEAVGTEHGDPGLGARRSCADGQLLVDGSLVDNLPIGAMAGLGEGPIIAVDLKAASTRGRRRSRRAASEDATLPAHRRDADARPVLWPARTRSDAARRHADLIVKPRNVGVGLFEWHQIDRARESGRAAAREALKTAPAHLFG